MIDFLQSNEFDGALPIIYQSNTMKRGKNVTKSTKKWKY